MTHSSFHADHALVPQKTSLPPALHPSVLPLQTHHPGGSCHVKGWQDARVLRVPPSSWCPVLWLCSCPQCLQSVWLCSSFQHIGQGQRWWTWHLPHLAWAFPLWSLHLQDVESGAEAIVGSVFQVTCPAAVFWMTIRSLPALETPPGESQRAEPVSHCPPCCAAEPQGSPQLSHCDWTWPRGFRHRCQEVDQFMVLCVDGKVQF